LRAVIADELLASVDRGIAELREEERATCAELERFGVELCHNA
jgi:hypothetical protein